MEIRRASAGGDSIDAPSGIHYLGSAVSVGAGDTAVVVTVFKDTTGAPDRMVLVSVLSTSRVAVIEYRREVNHWIFDGATEAQDTVIDLNFTASAQTKITAFAIDDPAGTGNRVVFVAGNNDDTTDTFEMDSIVLGTGSLSPTAVTIAGANQPTDTNTMLTISIPLSTTRVMTFFQDDAHFADITEAAGTYTFTYTDNKVEAIDGNINPISGAYSGICIGPRVVLAKSANSPFSTAIWELTTAAVLTEAFNPFNTQGLAAHASANTIFPAVAAINGTFAIATPGPGTGDASTDDIGYTLTTFDLDAI